MNIIHQAPRIAESSHTTWLTRMAFQKNHTELPSLASRLRSLADAPPAYWLETGANARPNLHGLLRYPAMMVPRMQGDIIETLITSTNKECHVLDPFVGSGTIMTESVLRGLDFTGVDINPLAVLVCEAKKAIDSGANIEEAIEVVKALIKEDPSNDIDADYENRKKWFSDENAAYFCKLRRAIINIEDLGARKVLWAVFAEVVRLCSNSRTSTYKLHIRESKDLVSVDRISIVFETHLRETLKRVLEYRALPGPKTLPRPNTRIICDDIRKADLHTQNQGHQILVTSPPYGDNQTTIPYGQFSYLALRWIPKTDLPEGWREELLTNTHALDSASLGGSVVNANVKQEAMRGVSQHFDAFVADAIKLNKLKEIRKVSSFMYDFYEALKHVNSRAPRTAHWVLTTGNRTAAGMAVPFDSICRDIISSLGGNCMSSMDRVLPTKRMPSRNSVGVMITTETTLVAEFN